MFLPIVVIVFVHLLWSRSGPIVLIETTFFFPPSSLKDSNKVGFVFVGDFVLCTMVNYHLRPPFGRICLGHFFSQTFSTANPSKKLGITKASPTNATKKNASPWLGYEEICVLRVGDVHFNPWENLPFWLQIDRRLFVVFPPCLILWCSNFREKT